MNARTLIVAAAGFFAAPIVSAQVATEAVVYYSEAVRCDAKLFKPANHSSESKAGGVVLAPGKGATRASIERYAQAMATRGIVALAIDYRGWGDCGGFLYFGEPVRWDDRLRFMQMTTTMKIRRGRIDPQAQVTDIRNAMTFLQGVPGVDRARIGVWGINLSAGHTIVTAGMDARVKAAVAQSPMLEGKNEPRVAFAPTREQQAAMIKLARSGAAPTNERAAKAMNDEEAKLALAQYKPYWSLDQIPQSTAMLFVVEEGSAADAEAAAKMLKGTSSVTKVAAKRATTTDDPAAVAAAEWFVTHLR
jgi:dienelactone hydrolase